MKTIGIDVSEWQGEIDWERVKPHIDFAIIRLGLGQNTLDAQARHNISECNRLGIPYGVYWFSYAYTADRARNEARNAIQRLKELDGNLSYPFWFDWEYDSRNHAAKKGYAVSNELLRDMAAAFCGEIQAAGYPTGIYANPDYVKNYYGEEIFQTFPLWYAYLRPEPDRQVPLHQFAWDYTVDGILGKVDVNYGYEAETNEEEYTMEMRNLRQGSRGEDVRALQILLSGRGYNGNMHTPDGIFGPNTLGAVKLYQQAKGLAVDGIAGTQTMASLLGR